MDGDKAAAHQDAVKRGGLGRIAAFRVRTFPMATEHCGKRVAAEVSK